jgi:hypothetical protein
MSAGRLRPTFTVALKPDRRTAIEAIRDRLALEDRFEGRWMGKGRWAEIHVPANDRRLWSPHLSIRVDPPEDATDGSTLFGRFAPNPEVWTFLMFLYFAVAFLVVLGAIFGYVQWASDEPSWGYWAVWIGLPVIGLIHVAGAVGRRLGQDQMVTLKAELDEVIEPLL